MIDVMCLCQAYERRQITEVKWIDGETNPADAMTKGKPCTALSQLIDTNRVELQAVEWVEQTKIWTDRNLVQTEIQYRAIAYLELDKLVVVYMLWTTEEHNWPLFSELLQCQ